MIKPLVSIITPSYNQGRFIRDTIESVLSQDYTNLEYIIIDGGSTDNTLSIIHEYKDKLKFISEKDEGQADAINKGFKLANGQIVAWLNSDDVYEPGCISKAVDVLLKNPECALVYGEGFIINESGVKIKQFEYTQDFNLWSLIHIWDYIMQPTTFFKADALKNVGYLNKDLNWTMDWDLWIKIALKYDVAYIPEVLACSREYKETKTSTGGEKRLQEILKLMQHFSGEENPYGYEIYYCSELLANVALSEARRKEVLERLTFLLTNLPVPNKDNRCLQKVNFSIRPGEVQKDLIIEIEQESFVTVDICINKKIFCKKKRLRLGVYRIPLYLRDTNNNTDIYVTFNSESLNKIRSSYDSWIKCYLKDRDKNMYSITDKIFCRIKGI